jgi:biopolymer transport protein ExbB/TolQ/biopolymer transport protein ExbD
MKQDYPRSAKLFCTLDRTPFVPVSAGLGAIYLFTAMLLVGMPWVGGSDLPKVNNPIFLPDANREDAIVLAVRHDGMVFWRQEQVSVGDLPVLLRDRVERRLDKRVYLNIDARARYREVARVWDALRSAGIETVAFLVDQRKTESQLSIVDSYQPNLVRNISYLWRSMDWLGRAHLALLALMLANTGVVICYRLYHYNAMRRQTSAFVRDAASAMRDGKFDKVIEIATRNRESHIASAVAEGLAAYASAPPEFTDAETVESAERAFRRSSKLLVAHLKVGLGTLANVASSASFIGFLGTVYGILGAFDGIGMEKHAALRMLLSTIMEALVPGALGLELVS